MGQKIIDIIGEIVQISGNSTVDSIIFAIIGFIAFSVAFDLVGLIFDAIGLYDAQIMSDAHWLIRVLVFGLITFILVKIAQFITWLCSFQWWVYLIAFVIIIGIFVLIYWGKYKSKKKYFTQNKNPPIEKNEESVLETQNTTKVQTADNRYYCPHCGAKLVKRHGTYGNFYGCDSYGKTGCTYTRKYL